MPGMSGRKMAECLVESRPDMKVLYVSGYGDASISQERRSLSAEAVFHRRTGHQSPRNAEVTFHLQACQFHLSARGIIRFPPGQAGNVVRGALGSILREIASAEDYARIFEPAPAGAGPSGLANRPRPFVIRAAALDGQVVEPGAQFCVRPQSV